MKKVLKLGLWMIIAGTVWVYAAEVAPKPQRPPEKFPHVIHVAELGAEKNLMGRDFIGADVVDTISQESFKDLISYAQKNRLPFIIARSVGVGEDSEQIHFRYYPILEAHDFIFGVQRGYHFGLDETLKNGIRSSRYKKPNPASNLFGPERFEDDIRGYMVPPLRYYASLDGKHFVYFGSEHDITEASAADSKQMHTRASLSGIFTDLFFLENQLSQGKTIVPWGIYSVLGSRYEKIGTLEEAVRCYEQLAKILLIGDKAVEEEFVATTKMSRDDLIQHIKKLKEEIEQQKKAKALPVAKKSS